MFSPLQLKKSPVFTEVIFANNPDYDMELSKFTYAFEQSSSYKSDVDDADCHYVTLMVRSSDESENIPVDITVSAYASFNLISDFFSNNENEDEKNKIVISNACSVLYASIRQKIIDITIQMPFSEEIILPLIQPSFFMKNVDIIKS